MTAAPSLPVRLALAEDRADLRAALLRRLRFFADVEVVLTAGDGAALLDAFAAAQPEERPQVVLMDLEMPVLDGVAATARLKAAYPGVSVVILTVFEHEEKIADALAAGAAGYLLKDEPADTIVGAVLEAARGGSPVSPAVARTLVARVREQERARRDTASTLAALDLTEREREVLSLLSAGETDEGIAARLFLSVHTVRDYTKRVYAKLGVHSRAAAARLAAEYGVS